MPYVNDSNFDIAFPQSSRDEYWRRVKFALRHYFNSDEQRADDLRRTIEDATIGEQLLLYHDDPLSVAADLAGVGSAVDEQVVRDFSRRFPETLAP